MVSPGASCVLAARCLDLLADPDGRRERGRRGRARILALFDAARTADDHDRLYREIMARGTGT
jgi:hypothetical protein